MIDYEIKALSPRKSGRAVLPPIEERVGAVVTYKRALNKVLRGLAKETRESVLPELRRDRGLTTDKHESWFRRLRATERELEAEAEATVRRILEQEATAHGAAFIASARRALGVDVSALVRAEDLSGMLEEALSRNVALIQSLGTDTAGKVEKIIYAATMNGTPLKAVSQQLQQAFGASATRADLIAQNEVSNLTSKMNETRQRQAGIVKYRWSTSADERVRPLHRQLDGKEYRWDKKTGAEDGLPPGRPIRCRCVARAVVEFP